MTTLLHSNLPNLNLLHRGKVRDMYTIDDAHILIITTDRISAFDVILPQGIPGKGETLTRLTNFWLTRTNQVANHTSDFNLADAVPDPAQRAALGDRAVVVKKLQPLPIEAIVRGYLIGSGWKDYQASGTLCGIPLPKNLQQAAQLPEPLYTPSTKAAAGEHDANIDFAKTIELVGEKIATQVKQISLRLYTEAAAYALARGIIIADTKFEFGLDAKGTLHLIDEVLTPDSSRFWAQAEYRPGISPPSYDKQIVRDYLETLTWNKTPPAPDLPQEIITRTAARYAEAEHLLTKK